ncbi:membrane protein [Marinobacter nanhaiticus D15-8W]|nr:membrane protein [Marinobacter nanhaiticus D15-8W]
MEVDSDDPIVRRGDKSRNLAVLVYLLQALSFFVGGITGLAGVIVNYVKLDDVRNTWVEPHFRWQIRTFWIGLLWCVIGFVTLPILIGWFVLLGISIWVIYRIVKGALALNDGKAP